MGGAWGNFAAAQSDADLDLPDAAVALDRIAPQKPPALVFEDARGRRLSLANYKGHTLIVNLWATWCGPCVAEIPSLAALAAKLKPQGVLVLPISIDLGGAATVARFFAANGVRGLPILIDPDGNDMQVLQSDSVPVSIIVNAAGKMVARTDTAANWDTEDTVALLQSLGPVVPEDMPNFTPV